MRSAAVLGAGTMGAQIAAHLANAGVPTLLLDLTDKVAREGLERARKIKPDPFFSAEAASLVSTGGFDTDIPRIKECDWIIEAIVERLDLKQSLLEKVDKYRAHGSIVSSNTSGIPIAAIAEGRSDDFRRHWLGTHFFNPPRYLKLLEIIPPPETDSKAIGRISRFADGHLGNIYRILGKQGASADRRGIRVCRSLDAALFRRLAPEEIAAPRSRTFRALLDRPFGTRISDSITRFGAVAPQSRMEQFRRVAVEVLLVLVLAGIGAYVYWQNRDTAIEVAPDPSCNLNAGPCGAALPGGAAWPGGRHCGALLPGGRQPIR